MQWVGYNLDTGEKLWGPTASQSAFDYYGNPGTTTLLGVACLRSTSTLAHSQAYSMPTTLNTGRS